VSKPGSIRRSVSLRRLRLGLRGLRVGADPQEVLFGDSLAGLAMHMWHLALHPPSCCTDHGTPHRACRRAPTASRTGTFISQ
jgi:hypothetical protein